MLPATNDDAVVDNDINDDILDADHYNTEVDDDVNDDNPDADHNDDALLRFCNINDILRTVGFAPCALMAEELDVVSSDELTSFIEGKRGPSWRKAMMEEMTSIKENDTWSLIDLPPGCKPIEVKWVFKVKQDEHGAVPKHKACLVVRSYVKQHDFDCDEVFTPLARLDSVHLLIALVAHEGGGAPYGRQSGILER
jgi:hypothetical protein